MSGRHGLWGIGLASLVAVSCGGVTERPGDDFALRVLDGQPIEAADRIYTPVRFAVDGCSSFVIWLHEESGKPWFLNYTKQPDGTFVTQVPVAPLQNRELCDRGVASPMVLRRHRPGKLVAICQDAQRTASAEIRLRDGPDVVYPRTRYGDLRALFPGDDPGQPWWIATSAYGGEVSLGSAGAFVRPWVPALSAGVYRNPLVRPRLARSGDRAFVTLGCESSSDCPQVWLGEGEWVAGERLAEIDLAGTVTEPRAIAYVSTHVVDMAFAEDGALVVVTDTSLGPDPDTFLDSEAERWGETIVWRVVPAPEGSEGVVVQDEATVLARFPRQTAATRLTRTASGALTFATLHYPAPGAPVLAHAYLIDGSAVTSRWDTILEGCSDVLLSSVGFSEVGVSLSPDGSNFVVPTCGHPDAYKWIKLDPLDGVEQWFGTGATGGLTQDGGSAWLPNAVAFWKGASLFSSQPPEGGDVDLYDAEPPHRRRDVYAVQALPGAAGAPALVDVIAVGDRLVLTTTTGVRILDENGTLVGGADPLPCGARVTAVAVQVGPTTVAVGAGAAVVTLEIRP